MILQGRIQGVIWGIYPPCQANISVYIKGDKILIGSSKKILVFDYPPLEIFWIRPCDTMSWVL